MADINRRTLLRSAPLAGVFLLLKPSKLFAQQCPWDPPNFWQETPDSLDAWSQMQPLLQSVADNDSIDVLSTNDEATLATQMNRFLTVHWTSPDMIDCHTNSHIYLINDWARKWGATIDQYFQYNPKITVGVGLWGQLGMEWAFIQAAAFAEQLSQGQLQKTCSDIAFLDEIAESLSIVIFAASADAPPLAILAAFWGLYHVYLKHLGRKYGCPGY